LGKEWIAKVTTARNRADQLLYLRAVRKGLEQTAEQFADNLEHTNNLTDWMPGTARLLIYDGSPTAWKTNFNEAGKNIDDASYPKLIAYMRSREQDSNDRQRSNE
jgi:hypothetical protein